MTLGILSPTRLPAGIRTTILERIASQLNRSAMKLRGVNPLYAIEIEPIHPIRLGREAIQSDRDRL